MRKAILPYLRDDICGGSKNESWEFGKGFLLKPTKEI